MKTENTNENTISIGLILDATLSFSKVYPQVYYLLEHLLLSLYKEKEENPDVLIAYSTTLLRDEPETMTFANHKTATTDVETLIQKLGEIDFYGGSEDGTEDLTAAVRNQLQIMEEGRKVLLMFTDSIPSDGNLFPDFSDDPSAGEEKNLSIGYIYSYEDEYTPIFHIVNRHDDIVENNINTCVYGGLKELLALNEAETLELAEHMAKNIIAACFA